MGAQEIIKYNVVLNKTGKVVGSAKTVKRARSIRDRKDNEYGAYVHHVQTVYAAVDDNLTFLPGVRGI